MASTSVQRTTRSEENAGPGVRSGKSADSRPGEDANAFMLQCLPNYSGDPELKKRIVSRGLVFMWLCLYHVGATKPVRKALGDVTNKTQPTSGHKSGHKKSTLSRPPLQPVAAGTSSARRKRVSKVDLDNPPEIEKMTPFREKVEGKQLSKSTDIQIFSHHKCGQGFLESVNIW